MLHIHTPDLTRYRIEGKTIVLTTTPHDISAPNVSPTFIGQRQRHTCGTASATLVFYSQKALAGSLVAGLVVYKDAHCYLRIFHDYHARTVNLQVVNEAQGIERMVTETLERRFVRLRFVVEYTEVEYVARFERDGGGERELGRVRVGELGGGDSMGLIVGIHALSDRESGLRIPFENFVVDDA